ncbi:hypothetical protein [Verminephrobacter aporrectodeae]|uniref:hypothetical protein n=1 Tax=Verminephrobacter aporrectodeae TaxID=1110389 RepID=UPI0022375274|nr:hypothetical protein [Verminephrobacter aporrectodeae]
MNMPRVIIYLDKESNLCISEVEEQNSNSKLIFAMPLGKLSSDDLDSVKIMVGKTVLDILERWHKQVFWNWETSPADEISHTEDDDDDDYISATFLVIEAISAKTDVYNASIEFLLQQAAIGSLDAKRYLEVVWPLIRDRLGNRK